MNFITPKQVWWESCGKWTPKVWWEVFNKHLLWSVADDLKFNREMAQITQKEVAARTGTVQPAIARLERGREQMTIGRLRKVANALGCVVRIEVLPLAHAIRKEYTEHQIPPTIDFSCHGTSTQTLSVHNMIF